MKKILLYIFFIFFLLSSLFGNVLKKDWPLAQNYQKACQILKQHGFVWQKNLSYHQINPQFAFAIVFPELMRYHSYTDFVENKALNLFYVPYGFLKNKKETDFSIGFFQMKPSFAQTLENLAFQKRELQPFFLLFKPFLAIKDLKKQRQKRIKRLLNPHWQGIYLACFIKAAFLIHPHLKEENLEQQLIFLATAYNSGLFHKKEVMLKKSLRKTYPYGPLNPQSLYSYAFISTLFLNQGCGDAF